MNTLRNLKVLKTSTKSYANKINSTLYTKQNNNMTNLLKNNPSETFNKSNSANKHNNSFLLNRNLKKYFATKAFYGKQKNLQSSEFNSSSELDSGKFNEAINLNFLYSAESQAEETDINKILNKLEDHKILNSPRKKTSGGREVDKSLLDKNMLYIALLDVNKRFPLKSQYDLSNYEKIIKAKLYRNFNNRKNFDESFYSKLESDSNDLNGKISSFVKYYKNDDLPNFVNSLATYIEALENETKVKFSEFFFVKFVEEIASLRNYLQSLMDKNEYNSYYSENLYNINNKALISLANELQIIAIECLGKAQAFSAEFAKQNEHLILDAINKYNLVDFGTEKNLSFKTARHSILFNKSISAKKVFFTSDFLIKNLIPFITNSISVLSKQYGENSTDVATHYYMLAYINLKLQNYLKAEEYIEKCFRIYSNNNLNNNSQLQQKQEQTSSSCKSILNKITLLQYLYVKSQLIGVHFPNKKETYLILKQASELIESIESIYYSLFNNNKNDLSEEISLEKNNDFSALKFKVNYNLALYYKQYNFILDQQACLEKSMQINALTLKSNRNLMKQYRIASKFLLELYENLSLKRNIYELAKKNFGLSYYIINDKDEQVESLSFYADLIVKNINSSFDKFNYLSLLNPDSSSFNYFRSNQISFVLSLISYFQKEKNNYAIGSILSDYLQIIIDTDPLQVETFENTNQILLSYYININSPTANYAEANRNLNKLRDQLQLEDFLLEESKLFEAKKKTTTTTTTTTEQAGGEAKAPSDSTISTQLQPEPAAADEFQKELNDKFYFYRRNKDAYSNWINLAISLHYNIILNLIKSNEYEELLVHIDFLLGFLNKLNESKAVGSVIEHAYLLINLNFLAAHYHLINNQKIYSVKYLKAVNSMITRFDWGSNTEINAYLTEMVKLINSI